MKRLLDIIISFCALIILSPLLLYLAYKIKVKIGSPVLFKQQRPGLNGKPFNMIKFRTMRDAYDKDGNPLPDNERMTFFATKHHASSEI